MGAGADNRIIDIGKNYPGPLLDLAWLVGLGANRSQLERFLPCCGLPGQDALFDRIVRKLGFDRPIASRLRFPGDYQATFSVLDAPPERQGELLAKVLKKLMLRAIPTCPRRTQAVRASRANGPSMSPCWLRSGTPTTPSCASTPATPLSWWIITRRTMHGAHRVHKHATEPSTQAPVGALARSHPFCTLMSRHWTLP